MFHVPTNNRTVCRARRARAAAAAGDSGTALASAAVALVGVDACRAKALAGVVACRTNVLVDGDDDAVGENRNCDVAARASGVPVAIVRPAPASARGGWGVLCDRVNGGCCTAAEVDAAKNNDVGCCDGVVTADVGDEEGCAAGVAGTGAGGEGERGEDATGVARTELDRGKGVTGCTG